MSKQKLIPELRFPEFQNKGEWELSTIGELGNFYYGKSAPKWSLSEDAPTLCVRYGELYTKFDTIINEIKSRTNIDPSDLKFSKGGEILVPRVGERATDFAKNCCYLPFSNIAIGEMISVFETKEFPIFYTHYFRTLWREFAEVVEGQNVKNLYYVNLEPIKIGKPSYEEQQKIASCLSSLDEVIAAHSQKLALLKDHKKGLMQNLFPQAGENVPKYRFKEFENDGVWVEKTLNDLCFNISSGKDKNSENGEFELYGSTGIIGKTDIASFTGDYILVARVGANAGLLNRAKGSFGVTDNTLVLDLKKNDSTDFIQYNLEKIRLNKLVFGSGQPLITGGQLKSLLFLTPKSDTEQQKIAGCLSSLDALITAQAEQIAQLKLHKKGLMQGLFPKIKD